MTFSQAVARINEQHLPDESEERIGLDRIVRALNDASSEVASAFLLGRTPVTETLTDTTGGELVLSPAQAAGAYDLDEVAVSGFVVKRLDAYRATLYRFVSGPPRYYVWERLSPQLVTFRPPPKGAVDVRLLIHKEMPTAALQGTQFTTDPAIWNGAYAPWHDLVIYKAVAKLLEGQSQWEEAGQYMQRYGAREQEFSAHLQGLSKDVAMAMQAQGAG